MESRLPLFDVNKDGKITLDDFVQIADNVSRSTNISPEQAAKTREAWTKWGPPNGFLTEKEYVAFLEEHYVRDAEDHKRETTITGSDMFDQLDLDKNGTISIQEFEIFYKACGITNGADILDTFQKIDSNHDGLIQRHEFIDDHVKFWNHPDPVAGKAYLYLIPSSKR